MKTEQAIRQALDALARHIAEQRAENESAPVCVHVAEAFNVLTALDAGLRQDKPT